MDSNSTGMTESPSTEIRSVFICLHQPNFAWDLNDTTFAWILVVIFCIASPITVLLNSLVIIAVNKRKELQKRSNIIFLSLAVADLLTGALTMPLSAAVDILILRQVSFEHVCTLDSVVNKTMIAFFSLSSLHHLTVIAWERYRAIQKWMDYKVIVTKTLLKKLAIVAVVFPLPAVGMVTAGVEIWVVMIWHIVEALVVVGCIIATGYFYVMVCVGVRKQKINEIGNVTRAVKAKLESKLAKTTAMLTASLIFSFVPAIVIAIVVKLWPVFGTNSALRLSEVMVQLNSLATPILYCYRGRRFRKAVLELLGMDKPRRKQPSVDAPQLKTRKDAIGSVELQNVKKPQVKTRSASCVPALGLDCAYPLPKPDKILLRRSMSAPKLNECSGSLGSQPHQPLAPILIKSERIQQAKSGAPNMRRTNLASQGASNPKRKTQRSNSWNGNFSPKPAKRCQKVQEKTVGRLKTAQ